jgi:hypothetical protein
MPEEFINVKHTSSSDVGIIGKCGFQSKSVKNGLNRGRMGVEGEGSSIEVKSGERRRELGPRRVTPDSPSIQTRHPPTTTPIVAVILRFGLLRYLLHNACTCTFLNVTMTARALPSALDPLNSSTLNKLHEAAPPSKKRKLEPDTAAGQLSATSIVIRVR